jgi:hypothetical protein
MRDFFSLVRNSSDEPGRRWSYGRLYVLLGTLPALYVWRTSPVAVQGGSACIVAGLVLLAAGARGWGLYFLAFGAGLLIL